ncbi:unnamed protein product, partial [Lampetra fluviatilis]
VTFAVREPWSGGDILRPYIRVSARVLGLSVLWGHDLVKVEVDSRYEGQLCGLCGDADGHQENTTGERRLSWLLLLLLCPGPVTRAAGQEESQQQQQQAPDTAEGSRCAGWLSEVAASCTLERSGYLALCVQAEVTAAVTPVTPPVTPVTPASTGGTCEVLAELARECARSGSPVGSWRDALGCPVPSCPEGEEFQDCGSPCEQSCSKPSGEISCDESCVPGCFCPEGSVRSNEPGSRKCLPRALCSCFQAGKLYADGDTARDTLGTW